MATIKLSAAIPDDTNVLDYLFSDVFLDSHKKTECTWDGDAFSLHLFGSQFDYNDDFSFIDSGSVEKAVFRDVVNDQILVTVTGAKFNFHVFGGEGTQLDASGFLRLLMLGNDRVIGSNAADVLFGGEGRDVLIGNKGSDVLNGDLGKDMLNGGAGNDTLSGGGGNNRYSGGLGSDTFVLGLFNDEEVITDFDAIGGGLKQDYLDIGDNEYDVVKDGRNTIIDLGPRGQVTLVGVTPNQVDDSDFVM